MEVSLDDAPSPVACGIRRTPLARILVSGGVLQFILSSCSCPDTDLFGGVPALGPTLLYLLDLHFCLCSL